MTEKISYIPARIRNAAVDSQGNRLPVAGADDIVDELHENKRQQTINSELLADIADRYTKSEVNSIVSRTPETDVIVLDVPEGSTEMEVLNALPNTIDPETGKNWRSNKLFRVRNDANTYYDECAWDGVKWVILASKDYGIDDVPTDGSENLVYSNGIYDFVKAQEFKQVEVPSGTTKLTIDPNKLYVFGEVSELEITLNQSSGDNVKEYMFQFTCPSDTDTPITFLPIETARAIRWANDEALEPEASMTYQVSIVNGLGVYAQWEQPEQTQSEQTQEAES